MKFKADPTISPTCRLCSEDNETFWHLVTNCSRLKTIREEVFLDKTPQTDDWNTYKILTFSKYPEIQGMLRHIQDYIDQPIYEIEHLFSDNSDSDNELPYRTYL